MKPIPVMKMWLTDNQQDIVKSDFVENYPSLSEKLIDRTLASLAGDNHIMVFPADFKDTEDLNQDSKILETVNDNLKTQNLIGFLGYQGEELTIHSRFSQNEQDYFLHYLLQKVLHINLVDFSISLSFEEQIYHLLIYLFPRYLQNALRKGIYKEYRAVHYNDSHLRGNIDIARHLRDNTPFAGKIAYQTREMTFDNPMMNLIRHVIEVIKQKGTSAHHILEGTPLVKQFVTEVIAATPNYNPFDRAKVVRQNRLNPIKHAYYHEYRQLQRLCLMILERREHDLRQTNDKFHGILFDISWLWEEYLALLLKEEYQHPNNRKKTGGVSFFSSRTHTVYPDFYRKDKRLILDAKYKRLETSEKGISREDLYQLTSYLHIFEADKAGLLYPHTNQTEYSYIGQLAGFGGELFKMGLKIPQGMSNYKEFVQAMATEEDLFLNKIQNENQP